jgi:hypothetical protein
MGKGCLFAALGAWIGRNKLEGAGYLPSISTILYEHDIGLYNSRNCYASNIRIATPRTGSHGPAVLMIELRASCISSTSSYKLLRE